MEHSVNGEKIKQLRINNSWSQEKLSVASGLSLRTIQRVENEGVCSLETRQAIAATFQVKSSALSLDASITEFSNQNLTDAKFDDINFTNVEITNSNLRNARFSEINLSNALFHDVNLRDVEITDANVSGMKIFGYLVTDLIEHYQSQRKQHKKS